MLGRPRTACTASSCGSKSPSEISAYRIAFRFLFSVLFITNFPGMRTTTVAVLAVLASVVLVSQAVGVSTAAFSVRLDALEVHTKKGNFTRESIHASRALRLADLGRRRIETIFGRLSGSMRWLSREKSLTLVFDVTVHVPSRSVLQGQWLEWRIEQRYVHLWVLIITSPRNLHLLTQHQKTNLPCVHIFSRVLRFRITPLVLNTYGINTWNRVVMFMART